MNQNEKKLLKLLRLRNQLLKNEMSHKGVHQETEWVIKELNQQIKELEKKV